MTETTKPTRVIGVDFGMARIGVSYSDEQKIIAFPMAMIPSSKKVKFAAQEVVKKLNEHQGEKGYEIEAIVVGMPLMMSGKKGLMADEVNTFIDSLKEILPDIPIVPWDERLSSVQAERSMREASMSRKKRTKHVDTVSAVIILQSYLDSKQMPGY